MNTDEARRPSEIMRGLGIRQAGDLALCEPTRPFELPREAELADRIVGELLDKATVVSLAHRFRHGMGLAAPQMGIGRSVAIVRPAGEVAIVLLNPTVIDSSGDCFDAYEGCLSCFDVRGLVPRPKVIEVEHIGLDGAPRITAFRGQVARLVMHEIDHLNGVLYDSRMPAGVRPISVTEYRQLVGEQR
jgi:peptide deformylase